MRCISLWQPWASLLASGAKTCETRGWPTRHRGKMLVHAAKKWNPDLAAVAADPRHFRPALEAAGVVFEPTEEACERGWNLPFGAVVGSVDVVDCYPTERVRVRVPGKFLIPATIGATDLIVPPFLNVTEAEHAFGDYSSGRYAWLCENPVRFATPIPYRGRQLLFDVRDDLIPAEYR